MGWFLSHDQCAVLHVDCVGIFRAGDGFASLVRAPLGWGRGVLGVRDHCGPPVSFSSGHRYGSFRMARADPDP